MVYKFFDKKTAGSANIDANESAFIMKNYTN